MALLLVDGFDDLSTSTDSDIKNQLNRRYLLDGTNYETRAPRLLGHALGSDNDSAVRTRKLPVSTDTLIVGFAFLAESVTASNQDVLTLYDGVDRGIHFSVNTQSGEIFAYRDGTYLACTTDAGIRANTWVYLEVKVKCHDSAGTLDLRIGESSFISVSGIDTKAGDHEYHDQVFFNLDDMQIDDVYIADSSGSVNNDFLGNCTVKHLFPDGDEGTNQWTASAGGDHYALVDEVSEDDDAEYVASATTDQVDLWTYDSISDIGDIHGIRINTICRDTDTPVGSLKTVVKSETTTSDGASQIVGHSDYDLHSRIVELDPHTSTAWTQTTVNAASFGVKVG